MSRKFSKFDFGPRDAKAVTPKGIASFGMRFSSYLLAPLLASKLDSVFVVACVFLNLVVGRVLTASSYGGPPIALLPLL